MLNKMCNIFLVLVFLIILKRFTTLDGIGSCSISDQEAR